jgi:hypothetical protein
MRLYTGLGIFLATLLIGLSGVSFLKEVGNPWTKFFIEPVGSAIQVDIDTTSDSLKSGYLLDGIEETGRGCGNGYAQGYELPNGAKLSEGSNCFGSFKEAKKEMQKWLAETDQVIERVRPVKKTKEQKSDRVVASFPVDEFGRKWVTVMWVQGKCVHWINAPDVEHAKVFENSEFNPYKFEE